MWYRQLSQKDGRSLAAFAFIGLGLMLLLGIGNFWSLFILLPGLALLAAFQQGGRSAAPLAVPAMLITGTGALLLFQSLTGYWESWGFAWTLYGVFLGLGVQMMGQRLEDAHLTKIGRGMAMVSAAIFATLGSLFLVLSSTLIRTLLMFAFFAAGAYLLMNRGEGGHKSKSKRKVKRSDESVDENLRHIQLEVESNGNGHHKESIVL